jgi:hypothetical protein
MVQYINHYADCISFGIHTGDYCGGNNGLYTDLYAACTPCVHPIYNCPGNHDCVTPDNEWSHPCDKSTVHGLLFNHTENWDVQFADCPFPMSYRRDFPGSNLRLIVLDLYYDIYPTRVWLNGLLEDALEKGMHVITAMHEPTDYITESRGTLYHHADDYNTAIKAGECRRTEFAFDHRGRVTFEDILERFIRRGGHYVCNLAGHDHVDSFGYTAAGVLNVLVQNGTDWDLLGDANRVPGTKSFDCFNVVGVDTNLSQLKIIRIGCNVDHCMREKNVLCYDYRTGNVIYQR